MSRHRLSVSLSAVQLIEQRPCVPSGQNSCGSTSASTAAAPTSIRSATAASAIRATASTIKTSSRAAVRVPVRVAMLMFIPGRVMVRIDTPGDLRRSEGRFGRFDSTGRRVQDASGKPRIGGIQAMVGRSLPVAVWLATTAIGKTEEKNDHGRDEDHANDEKNEAGNNRRSRHAIIDRIRKIHSITAFQVEKESSGRHLVRQASKRTEIGRRHQHGLTRQPRLLSLKRWPLN